jgi:hypothetical protein
MLVNNKYATVFTRDVCFSGILLKYDTINRTALLQVDNCVIGICEVWYIEQSL